MATDGLVPPQLVHVDPFYEGESPQARNVPAASRYSDVSAQVMQDGRPVSNFMPSMRGLRGTVIPHASPIGEPYDYDANDVSQLEIHIDPHMPGQTSTLLLGELRGDVISRGMETARRQIPSPRGIETQRLRSAAAFHAMAGVAGTGFVPAPGARENVAPVSVPSEPTAADMPVGATLPQTGPAPTQVPQTHHYNGPRGGDGAHGYQQPASQPARAASPLAAFGRTRGADVDRPLRHLDIPAPLPQPGVSSGPPTKEVLFEIEGFGQHTAKYHDILVYHGFIVLVYDNRFEHGSKYFPSSPPNPAQLVPPLALAISGTNDVYLVQTTGFQYVYAGCEHCVLLVEQHGSMAG